MTKMKVGDEIEVNGKVYVVVLNAAMILANGDTCEGCVGCYDIVTCHSLCYINEAGWLDCKIDRHLIFKLKGDSDVQDENADDRQVSLTEERQPTDMG